MDATQTTSTTPTIMCPTCGTQNDIGARYCQRCATPLVAGVATPVTKQVTPDQARVKKDTAYNNGRALLAIGLTGVVALEVWASVVIWFSRTISAIQQTAIADFTTMVTVGIVAVLLLPGLWLMYSNRR